VEARSLRSSFAATQRLYAVGRTSVVSTRGTVERVAAQSNRLVRASRALVVWVPERSLAARGQDATWTPIHRLRRWWAAHRCPCWMQPAMLRCRPAQRRSDAPPSVWRPYSTTAAARAAEMQLQLRSRLTEPPVHTGAARRPSPGLDLHWTGASEGFTGALTWRVRMMDRGASRARILGARQSERTGVAESSWVMLPSGAGGCSVCIATHCNPPLPRLPSPPCPTPPFPCAGIHIAIVTRSLSVPRSFLCDSCGSREVSVGMTRLEDGC
jgi:hypothetical protein